MSIIAFILLNHRSRLAPSRALFSVPLWRQLQVQFETLCAQVPTSATTPSARKSPPETSLRSASSWTQSISPSFSLLKAPASPQAPSRSQVARATHQIQGHPRPTRS